MSTQHGPCLLVHGKFYKAKFIQPKKNLLPTFVLRFRFGNDTEC